MPMPTFSRRNIPFYLIALLAGSLWGVAVARLLGYGLMLQAFNMQLPVMMFVLLCAGLWLISSVWMSHKVHDVARYVGLPITLALPALIDLALSGYSVLRSVVLLLTGVCVYGLLQLKRRRWGLLPAMGLPFAVYLLDISPYVGRADTFEFQVVAPTLGIAHPSGYPLYTLIGKLFSWLPFGSMAWRVNLSSAFFAVLACGMVYWILSDPDVQARFKAHSLAVPVIAAWVLGFSPTLWSRSIEAEVYSLNAFIVSVSLFLAMRWLRKDAQVARIMPWYGLLAGLALASHITLGAIVLLAGVIMLSTRPWPRVRTLIDAALLGLAGAALYAYIPLRWPAVQGGQWMSPRQFIDFVTNAGSGGALRPLAFIQDLSRWGLVWRLFTQQFTVIGMGIALAGWVAWLIKQWRFAVGTLLMVLAWVWFNLGFYVADPDYSAFLIPAHVVITVWLGCGIYTLLGWLKRYQSWGLPLILVVLAVLPGMHVWDVAPTLDTRSQGQQDELWARYVLDLPLEKHAAILADSEKFPPLYYLQQVEGLRSDLDLVTLFNEDQYRADLHQRLEAGQTVYMARYLPGLDVYGVRSLGPLVEVAPHGMPDVEPGVLFQPSNLSLAAYTLTPDPYERPLSHLTLVWQVLADISDDLEVHIRLRDSRTDAVVWSYSVHRPVSGYSATTAWQAGQVIHDYYALTWPEWLVGEELALDIALFQRFSENAEVLPDGLTWLSLGQVVLPMQVQTGHAEMGVTYADGVTLMDADVPADVFATTPVTIDLRWSCALLLAGDGQTVLHWSQDGQPLSQAVQPVTGSDDAALACQGSALRRYIVNAPASPGTYALSVGRTNPDGRVVPAQCSWLGKQHAACVVANVSVGPAAVGLANYQNTILLVDAGFDASELPAGGMLHVDLDWRGLQHMDLDYTVFLQVIGPDGQIYGQVDSWPVQGARPTSGWLPGEDIRDSYSLYLEDEHPAGDYELIVGWYLLADMRRLMRYSDGVAMGDYVSLGEFTLP